MDDVTRLAALETAAAALTAIRSDRYDQPVPACPGWEVRDLIEHTALIHAWAAEIVRTRPAERIRRARERPAGTDLAAFSAQSAATLLQALREADLEAGVWTFTGAQPTSWWLRRQLHETLVHRWDGQAAGGVPDPIDPELAIDGIDELFGVFVASRFDASAFGANGQRLHLHATDAEGEWLLRFADDRLTITAEHGKGDVAARGPAADLFLLMWNRIPIDRIETFGDEQLLRRFLDAARV